MGRVCKRVRDTKANLKNERGKSDCIRYLGPVSVVLKGNGNAKNLVKDFYEEAGKGADHGMDFEDGEDCTRENNEIQAVCCSPIRFFNAVPLRNELCVTPKTPCKRQVSNLMGTPRTPCNQGRLCHSPRVLANLLRTPKTPCSKSRFQTSPSKVNSLLTTPKTPRFGESISESRLESLPIDILVKVLCHLHHDQLKPSFHVSKRVREAVQLARQFHFNFTTPDRSRQALLNTKTPQPWEHWPFIKLVPKLTYLISIPFMLIFSDLVSSDSSLNRNRDTLLKTCPQTPKAPRHSTRPPPKFDSTVVYPIDDALFQESAFPSRLASSSYLTRSITKSQLASNRVLFYSNDSNCCNSLL